MGNALKTTPLHRLHVELSAKMVPFAGYDMPVQYPSGILAEHAQCREKAALFDVGHMGQIALTGTDRAAALERLMPMDVAGLAEGRQRYGLFLDDNGGILDDLMFANLGDRLYLVVNAARKEADAEHLRAGLAGDVAMEVLADRSLLALQGPKAEGALAALASEVAEMRFMDAREVDVAGQACIVTRSGYTGEDGFEISVPADAAEALARRLLDHPDVAPAGLGARDSLRIEAGLPLHGTDIHDQISPVQARLTWAIQKARRAGGDRASGFAGAEAILAQMADGVADHRVGLRPEGRAPVRGGAVLHADETSDVVIGAVTSGVFGPTVGGPVAMGYVPAELSEPGTRLFAAVRGKRLPVVVHTLPFVAQGYKR